MEVAKSLRQEYREIVAEIEHNADQDTLFERMVLARLKKFGKRWFTDGPEGLVRPCFACIQPKEGVKEIRVTRVKRNDRSGGIAGNCDFCGQFPCAHVTEQGYWVSDRQWKINNAGEFLLMRALLRKERDRLLAIPKKKRTNAEKAQLRQTEWLLNEAFKMEDGFPDNEVVKNGRKDLEKRDR